MNHRQLRPWMCNVRLFGAENLPYEEGLEKSLSPNAPDAHNDIGKSDTEESQAWSDLETILVRNDPEEIPVRSDETIQARNDSEEIQAKSDLETIQARSDPEIPSWSELEELPACLHRVVDTFLQEDR